MPQSLQFRNINKIAVPALIAGIAEPFLSITDTAIVGNMDVDATESLAAVGIVGAFISMLVWILGQTRSAISSIVSQYLGAGKLEEIKPLPAQAIMIVTILSILILGITYPFADYIFSFYNAEGKVLDLCLDYYRIRVFGFPFTLFTFAIFGTFRGLQNTFYPMVIALIGALLNVVLDFVFVYGVDGYVPAMNIEGAAYASVIAQIVMALISAVILLKKTSISLRVQMPFHSEARNMTFMMLNLFVRTLALNAALYFGVSYATAYGKEYIAAYTIALNLWFLGAFILDGYSSAGNILAGKYYGAKDFDSLRKLSKVVMQYAIGVSFLVIALGSWFYLDIGRLFTKDPFVLDQFYNTFWIVLAMQPFCAIAFIYDGIYKGLGYMKFLRNLLIMATCLVFIPTIYFLDRLDYQLYAIWSAFFLWIIFRGGALFFDFRKRFLSV